MVVVAALGCPPVGDTDPFTPSDVGFAYGFAVTTRLSSCPCVEVVSLEHGNGKEIITGRLTTPMKECVQQCLLWVRSWMSRVVNVLPATEERTLSPVALYALDRDLHIHVSPTGCKVDSTNSAAVALALVALVTGRVLVSTTTEDGEEITAIVGEVQPDSLLEGVGNFDAAFIQACASLGFKRIIMDSSSAEDAIAAAATKNVDLSGIVVGADDLMEVLELLNESATDADGPNVPMQISDGPVS